MNAYPQYPAYNSEPARRTTGGTSTGLAYAGAFVAIIWALHILNVLVGGMLYQFGIQPLDVSSLWHILTAPWIHADFAHLTSNTVPGAIFAFLIGRSGARVWWEVTAFVVAVGGLGIWFFGGAGTNHFGASILVYGWLAYLIVRGIFQPQRRTACRGNHTRCHVLRADLGRTTWHGRSFVAGPPVWGHRRDRRRRHHHVRRPARPSRT